MHVITQPPILLKSSLNNKYDDSAINWVRMIAMLSIVMVHCVIYPINDTDSDQLVPFQLIKNYQVGAYQIFNQFLRFGSIHFFLVAGFLVGKHSDSVKPLTYFTRRLSTITIPYLLSFILYWLKSILYTLYRNQKGISSDIIQLSIHKANIFLFSSAYWFVPNYILGLASLLIFRRYIDKLWFGFIWLMFAWMYGLNLHFKILAIHTSMLFLSYTFYIWLGVYLARHISLQKTAWGVKSKWWLLITICLYFISYWEGTFLTEQKVSDPFHSLRITNQLFAIALFMFLIKNNCLDKLSWLKPRRESFGIYLYHMFFAVISVRIGQYTSWWPFRYSVSYAGPTLVLLSILQGMIVYLCTLLFVKTIEASRLRWLIGLKSN